MKASIRTIGKEFSTHRMLKEYSERFYIPALENWRSLHAADFAPAKELAAYIEKATKAWPNVAIADLLVDAKPIMERGDTVDVAATVNLAGLEPNEASVELYHGTLSSQGEIVDAERNEMTPTGKKGELWEYRITVTCKLTGQHGYSARILPKHPALASPYVPGLVRWA